MREHDIEAGYVEFIPDDNKPMMKYIRQKFDSNLVSTEPISNTEIKRLKDYLDSI